MDNILKLRRFAAPYWKQSVLALMMLMGRISVGSRRPACAASDEDCIRDATELLVIREGEIIERGSRPKLLADGGCYYQLYKSQFKGHAT